MQVAQVEDKVELIMHGGFIILYLVTINILLMKNMVDFLLQIIVQLQGNFIKKQQIHILLVIALQKEMEDMELKYYI